MLVLCLGKFPFLRILPLSSSLVYHPDRIRKSHPVQKKSRLILKDEAEGLKQAATRAKEGPVQRAATALERAMDDFRRIVTAISDKLWHNTGRVSAVQQGGEGGLWRGHVF